MESIFVSASTSELASAACRRSSADAPALERRLAFVQQQQLHLHWRVKTIERALLATLPLLKNQRPVKLSSVNGPATQEAGVLAELDQYVLFSDQANNEYLFVRGWAWSMDAPIAFIEFLADGARGQRLDYGFERPDVQRHFDGPPEMKWSGFAALIRLPDGCTSGTPFILHVCNEQGAWKRFKLQPATSVLARSLKHWWGYWQSTDIAALGDRRREARLLSQAKLHLHNLKSDNPLSFVMVVDDQPSEALHRLYASFRTQIYTNWELILAPLHQRAEQRITEGLLEMGSDARVRFCEWRTGSRGDLFDAGIRSAKGNFVGFLDGQERLLPDALAWIAVAVMNTTPGWLYTDAACVDGSGKIIDSDYKPDFSDLHLRAEFFTKGLSLYRRNELLDAVRERSVCEQAEEYDLALRMSRRLGREKILHIPEVLVHAPKPVACTSTASRKAQVAAVQMTFNETGVEARVQPHANCLGVRQIELTSSRHPNVAVVVATRNKARLLRQCLTSLRSATVYQNLEIIVINNQSTEPDLFDLLEENADCPGFSHIDFDQPFNHSAMHNEVIFATDADFVALVNNDVRDFSPSWLEQLVGVMELDDKIACVSPLLLYPDGRVQHAGIAIDDEYTFEHIHLYAPSDAPDCNGRLHCLQDVAACSGACLLVRVSAFREVGGFDSRRYPVDFNDIDLCIRWRQSGYRCVYQPAVRAVHVECASRDVLSSNSAGLDGFRKHIKDREFRDPYFSPHLVLKNGQPQERWTRGEARQRQLVRLVERLESLSNRAVRHAA